MTYDVAIVNDNSTQKMNSAYQRLTGSETIAKAIQAFKIIGYIGVFLSIAGSALGFYHDFYKVPLLREALISLPLALLFAVVADYARHHLLQLAVNLWESGRYILSVSLLTFAIGLTLFLISMHFKGMLNMEQNENMKQLQNVVQHEREIEDRHLAQSKVLIKAVENMTSSAYTNGDVRDDILVAKTAKQYGELVSKLTDSPTTSYATKALIEQNEESSRSTKDSMSFFLPIIEIFTLSSLLSMFVLVTLVDKGAKETSSMKDEMKRTRDNIYALAQEMILNKTTDDLASVFALFQQEQAQAKNNTERKTWEELLSSLKNKYPTPTQQEPTKQDTPPQLGGRTEPNTTQSEEQKRTKHSDPMNGFDGSKNEEELDKKFKFETEECIEESEVVEQPKYIDPALFSDEEQKLIKTMWANGTRRVGQMYTREIVEQSLAELYSPAEVKGLMYLFTPLNAKLKGQDFVHFINGIGYFVDVEMSSVNKV